MTAYTRFSAIDAARIALTSGPVASTPTRDRTLVAAAAMWCRELTIPSLRRLAAEVGKSPVTVLQPFGRVIHIYAEVIRREWTELEAIAGLLPHERSARLARHAAGLELLDPDLVRLPPLVEAAVAGALSSEDDAAGHHRSRRFHVPPVVGTRFRPDEREAM